MLESNDEKAIEKSLALVQSLALVEEFRSEIVKSKIHLKLLENIEKNSEDQSKDQITASSAVTLSRMLEPQII